MSTISAVIPTYNRASVIVEALESALDQTRPANEIIVVDDGSTDETKSVVARYGAKVRYIRQENGGPSAARNRGIQEASSDFIALLDSDDLWVRDRLERQCVALEANTELDLLFGLESKFRPGKPDEAPEMNGLDGIELMNSTDYMVPDPLGMLLTKNCVATSSVLFRRSCVEKVGSMDVQLRLAEDLEYWIRFALHGFRFGFVNHVLCRRRLHEGNLVNQTLALKASAAEVLSRYRDYSPEHRERVARSLSGMHYDLGSAFLMRGDWNNAYLHLKGGRPIHQNGLRWRIKLTAASLLCRLSGKHE